MSTLIPVLPNGHDSNLLGCQPSGERSCIVLYEDCDESLERAADCTVDNDRTMRLIVTTDVLQTKSLRSTVVELNRSQLPATSNRIGDMKVNFRAIECPVTLFDIILTTRRF